MDNSGVTAGVRGGIRGLNGNGKKYNKEVINLKNKRNVYSINLKRITMLTIVK